jgi:hypothetical protein
MADVSDEDMTAEEFDRRAAQGEPVEIRHVDLQRPWRQSAGPGYSVQFTEGAGVSASQDTRVRPAGRNTGLQPQPA